MDLRYIQLRALMAENDFIFAARTGASPDEIKYRLERKEYWAARLRFEKLRIEKGPKFKFFHELKVWQRERRAALCA
jgi:hypothetical protein